MFFSVTVRSREERRQKKDSELLTSAGVNLLGQQVFTRWCLRLRLLIVLVSRTSKLPSVALCVGSVHTTQHEKPTNRVPVKKTPAQSVRSEGRTEVGSYSESHGPEAHGCVKCDPELRNWPDHSSGVGSRRLTVGRRTTVAHTKPHLCNSGRKCDSL